MNLQIHVRQQHICKSALVPSLFLCVCMCECVSTLWESKSFCSASRKHWIAQRTQTQVSELKIPNQHTTQTKQETERRLINDYKCVYMLISLYHTLFTLLMLLLLWRRVVIVAAAVDCRWLLPLIYFDFVARVFSLLCVCVVYLKWTEQICAYMVHTRSFIHGNADISLASKLCQRKKYSHWVFNSYYNKYIFSTRDNWLFSFSLSLALSLCRLFFSHLGNYYWRLPYWLVWHIRMCATHYTKY